MKILKIDEWWYSIVFNLTTIFDEVEKSHFSVWIPAFAGMT